LFTLVFSTFFTGNVYIADFINCRIRKVTVLTGIITTVAGSSASASYSGDNGQATAATLNWPVAITLDSSGIQCTNILSLFISLSLS
jgi:hypothetical protein